MEEERIRKKEKDRREIRRVGKRDENEYISLVSYKMLSGQGLIGNHVFYVSSGFFFSLSLIKCWEHFCYLSLGRKKKKKDA